MKKTAKAKMQEEIQQQKTMLDGILKIYTDEKIINLLIERRAKEISCIREEFDSDLDYAENETDSYRSAKDDARSRLPGYKKDIKLNENVIKQLKSLQGDIKKIDNRYC